jgi:hypothetical protein
MFDTRAWRGPAVVGGDGIEPPTSTELADTVDEVGPQIAIAVEAIQARFAAQHGLKRLDKEVRPVRVNPIIETRTAPTAPPPGMVRLESAMCS